MRRKLRDSVVVITGASSGIGRAAAALFAGKGATVVLAARGERALEEAARECERAGGRALVVKTDVTDEEAVRSLARRAVETFGRIDVWVNNAAVTLFGRIEDVPYVAYRRVLETNLLGYVHGARAVIPIFRQQGSGVLINNASMVARVGQPFASAYVASKWGIRGLGECLRQELRDTPGIRVSTLLPASIDTPLFQHAANYTGWEVKPIAPVYSADRVARAIVALARRPKREMFVGSSGRAIAMEHDLAPGLTERIMAHEVEKRHFRHDRSAAPTPGNLFEPMPEPTGVSGGWKRPRETVRKLALASLAVAVPATAFLFLARR